MAVVSGTGTVSLEGYPNHVIDGLTVYGACVQDGAPTPDAPVEIKAVRGPNLANMENVVANAYLGTTITTAQGHLVYYAPCEPNTSYTIAKTMRMLDNGKVYDRFAYAYTKDVPAVGVALYGKVQLQGSDTTVAYAGQRIVKTLTTGDDAAYIVVWAGYDSVAHGTYDDAYSQLQIERGAVLHGYAPYGCLGLAATGRNLLKPFGGYSWTVNGITYTQTDDGIHVQGTATALSDIYLSDRTDKNVVRVPEGTYTFSTHGLVSGVHAILSGSGTNGFPYQDFNGVDKSATGTVTDGSKPLNYVVIRVDSGATVDTVVYLQFEKGSTATEYEPYREQVSYIDLQGDELCAMPDEVKDELACGSDGRIAVAKNVWRGTWRELMAVIGRSTSNFATSSGRFYMLLQSSAMGYHFKLNVGQNYLMRCSHFEAIGRGNIEGTNGRCSYHSGPSDGYITFTNTAWSTTSDANTWFDEHADEIIVELPLVEPYTVDLGYVELPDVRSESALSVAAEVDPAIDVSLVEYVVGGGWLNERA